MKFNESITLDTYSDNAKKQFNEMQSRLSQIESSFQTRMNSKTLGGLIVSYIGNLLWLSAFIICAVIFRNIIDGGLLIITLIVAMGLIALMLIDNIMNFSYYGKISNYGSEISQLQNRVSIGKNSIQSNHDAFMSSRAKGWNYVLNAGDSIPEEAITIETTMSNMEFLATGFINGAKNVLYYGTLVMITIAGCVAFFPASGEIMNGISGASLSGDTITGLNIIALILVGIVEVILAKLVWSKTDCTVTNTTLFIMLLGPVAFLALVAIATLLIMLVIGIVKIILYILGIVIVGAIAIGCLCGG